LLGQVLLPLSIPRELAVAGRRSIDWPTALGNCKTHVRPSFLTSQVLPQVRRDCDPKCAITAARTLVETVWKHILDEAGIAYSDDAAGALVGIAVLAAARGRAGDAALCRGAAESAYASMGSQARAAEVTIGSALLAEARASLGEQAWRDAVARGRALSLRQVAEFARVTATA
jgi:hypothetical protein